MRTKRPIKTMYKNLKGIIIPQASYSEESLALLTPEGNVIPILPNEKLIFLKNLLWESVTVFGKLRKKKSKTEGLEVIFFSSSSPPDLSLDFDSDIKNKSKLESSCA